MHHSSTSTDMPSFIEIEETFCGRTDVWIFETHFIRSTRKSRPNDGAQRAWSQSLGEQGSICSSNVCQRAFLRLTNHLLVRGVTSSNILGWTIQGGVWAGESLPQFPVGGVVSPSPERTKFCLKRRVLAHFEQTGVEIALL